MHGKAAPARHETAPPAGGAEERPARAPILEMRSISKSFPGVKALTDVTLSVRAGDIHAIVGENGAGKSTLMKVLSGVYPAGSFEGEILFDGEERRFRGIADSEKAGIIIIHQELALVPLLSIAENIFLGNETAAGGVINWPLAFKRTQALLQKVGLREPPSRIVADIGVGKQQLVEIAKALSKEVRLLILDEPTASLNETDSEALLALLKEFRAQGITSIIISHKLNEVMHVADRVTVLRDGKTVATREIAEATESWIVQNMVGRPLDDRFPKRNATIGETLFEVRGWRVQDEEHAARDKIKGVDLKVRAGEVVGIAGLMGSGRTEFAMSVFGRSYGAKVSGEAQMYGRPVDLGTVQKALAQRIAYVTEDRKALGLVLDEPIMQNISLGNLKAVSKREVIDDMKELKVATGFRERLRIKSAGVFQKAVELSGGNQQKVVLGKWLFTEPDLLILDEPTRGIDVGAKYEIYKIINDLAESGKGIILISSEMPEVLGMADRIYVMCEGAFAAEMPAAEASQERIMAAIVQHGAGARAGTRSNSAAASGAAA